MMEIGYSDNVPDASELSLRIQSAKREIEMLDIKGKQKCVAAHARSNGFQFHQYMELSNRISAMLFAEEMYREKKNKIAKILSS